METIPEDPSKATDFVALYTRIIFVIVKVYWSCHLLRRQEKNWLDVYDYEFNIFATILYNSRLSPSSVLKMFHLQIQSHIFPPLHRASKQWLKFCTDLPSLACLLHMLCISSFFIVVTIIITESQNCIFIMSTIVSLFNKHLMLNVITMHIMISN